MHDEARLPESQRAMPEFDNGATIHLSCEGAAADERCQNPLVRSIIVEQGEDMLQLNALSQELEWVIWSI